MDVLYKERLLCKSGKLRNTYIRVMPAVHFPASTYNNQLKFFEYLKISEIPSTN